MRRIAKKISLSRVSASSEEQLCALQRAFQVDAQRRAALSRSVQGSTAASIDQVAVRASV
jgi:hypothetical protein